MQKAIIKSELGIVFVNHGGSPASFNSFQSAIKYCNKLNLKITNPESIPTKHVGLLSKKN